MNEGKSPRRRPQKGFFEMFLFLGLGCLFAKFLDLLPGVIYGEITDWRVPVIWVGSAACMTCVVGILWYGVSFLRGARSDRKATSSKGRRT